jgi:hypothetical protein
MEAVPKGRESLLARQMFLPKRKHIQAWESRVKLALFLFQDIFNKPARRRRYRSTRYRSMRTISSLRLHQAAVAR